ncbi:MAG: hypothetical protein BGO78_01905 [Chloroflexi bacterium 44-23]|nr:MAG: hypothetical protein BGO78_01905 [Chloroflexi bacterium 44-23]
MNKKLIVVLVIIVLISVQSLIIIKPTTPEEPLSFSGESALKFAESQLAFGNRTPGSHAHQLTIEFIQNKLNEFGWQTNLQEEDLGFYTIKNIIASRNLTSKPWIILAAHYDTRFFADQDPNPQNRLLPVPGANDGASGVAVLLELARVLPPSLERNVWLVFFDAEDQGRINNWDWILGSTSFVNQLEGNPDKVVIIDMIGDADLNLYYEGKSDPTIRAEIWEVAAKLGYKEIFIPLEKYTMLDDHIPFLNAGIPAVDIIDFDYPYWHTRSDVLENISIKSLQAVGDTIFNWLLIP